MVSEDQLAFLRSIDTPTVCNLIEIVAPARRGAGYTASHLRCPFPDLPPMVGFAKTATIRARDPVGGPSYMQKRLDYLDYVAAAPRPSIVVIEDQDEPPGYGAFWGEVQTNVHKALGCTVTNGSIRDLAAVAEGFQMLAGSIAPSHAYVRVVEFGISVTIHSGGSERRSHPCRPARRRCCTGAKHRRDGGGPRRSYEARGKNHRRRPRAGRDGREHQGRDDGLDDVNEPCWGAIGRAPDASMRAKPQGLASSPIPVG